MKRMALVAFLLCLATGAEALTSLSVRKVYGREIYTVADKTADDQFFVDGINAVYAYFPGTDSLKIVYTVTDYLKGKAGRLVQLASTESLKVVHARLTETTLDSIKGVAGTNTTPLQDTLRVHNITVAFTGGGSWPSRVFGVDSLQTAVVKAQRARIDSILGAVTVTGQAATFSSGITVSSIKVTGTANLDGPVTSALAPNFSGGLTVSSAKVTGTIEVDGTTNLDGPVTSALAPNFSGGLTASSIKVTGTTNLDGPVTSALAPNFSGGLTVSSLKITGLTTATGRLTASAGLTSTISSTFSGGLTAKTAGVTGLLVSDTTRVDSLTANKVYASTLKVGTVGSNVVLNANNAYSEYYSVGSASWRTGDGLGTSNGYFAIRSIRGNINAAVWDSLGNMYLASDLTQDSGTADVAWDDIYADDFNNVSDLRWLDEAPDGTAVSDVADICAIRPSEAKDEFGYRLVDDSTLPTDILSRHDKDWVEVKVSATGDTTLVPHKKGDVAYNEPGVPMYSLRAMDSKVLGAIRELDARVRSLESQNAALLKRIEALEAR